MNPESGASPYDAAIADVETRIRNLQTTLDTLMQLRAQSFGDGASATATGAVRASEKEITHDTFFGMTIADAAKKYLTMVKVTKSTAEISDALERGGLKHSSKSFATTVRSILGPREDFLRVPNGDWGLSAWYPGAGRGNKPKSEKPKFSGRAKPEKATKATAKASADGNPNNDAGPFTRNERILMVMQADPNKAWTAGAVAKVLSDKRRLVQAMMSGLVKSGRIVKTDLGYELPKIKAA